MTGDRFDVRRENEVIDTVYEDDYPDWEAALAEAEEIADYEATLFPGTCVEVWLYENGRFREVEYTGEARA